MQHKTNYLLMVLSITGVVIAILYMFGVVSEWKVASITISAALFAAIDSVVQNRATNKRLKKLKKEHDLIKTDKFNEYKQKETYEDTTKRDANTTVWKELIYYMPLVVFIVLFSIENSHFNSRDINTISVLAVALSLCSLFQKREIDKELDKMENKNKANLNNIKNRKKNDQMNYYLVNMEKMATKKEVYISNILILYSELKKAINDYIESGYATGELKYINAYTMATVGAIVAYKDTVLKQQPETDVIKACKYANNMLKHDPEIIATTMPIGGMVFPMHFPLDFPEINIVWKWQDLFTKHPDQKKAFKELFDKKPVLEMLDVVLAQLDISVCS